MSEIFLRICDRGPCHKATQKPKNLMAREGGTAEDMTSAPLQPLLRQNSVLLSTPPTQNPAKAEPERMTKGQKGPSALSRKENPLNKETAVHTRKGLNLVWKRVCCGDESERGRVIRPENNAMGKANRPWGTIPKGFGGCVPQPPCSYDKQLARMSKSLVAKPGGLIHAPHMQAKGDQAGVPTRAPPGTFRTGVVGLRRSKKPPRQTSFFKGTALAVAHGNMDVKRKSNHKFARPPSPSLDVLELGDLIEIFRFGYQHWAIYVGNGFVIHLAPPSEYAGAGCASIMSTLTDKALVKKELLQEVAGKHRYRVNNKHDTKFPPLPRTKIVQRAEEMVGQMLQYKVTSENCEHFVTELRYGVPRSDQVRDALVGVSIAGLGLAALGLFGAAVVKRKKQQNQ
ncbi:uncharacterized protein LOC117061648 isoform X1 [Lacerta agilis]|uniref:uncharacterized protein LOC117061648 isoform X1 n=2 Tax=Lacerta agilis TaxID=80427 RepID=UPI0014191AA3|nr:uncharacterized protein LOC117061648 isoform X1 [Lacerta agilis]